MPGKRVTMQDIADACGLSRNTVSKVFNGRGAVPQATRELIRQKARELGYGLLETERLTPQESGIIALLTSSMPVDYHFGTYFVTAFTDQISRAGYTLKMFETSAEELRENRLPPHFIPQQITGVVAIELFDAGYLNMVCGLRLPTIVIDSPAHSMICPYPCDYVAMENVASIRTIVRHLVELGARRIGFVGDRLHCGSFYERWFAFRGGMEEAGLELDERLCILAPDASPYSDTDWLIAQLNRMPRIPDAFVCANDYLAIHLMSALQAKGLAIPADVMVTGFDGTSQSALANPPLTTVQIPSLEIGRMAADFLLARIRNPAMPYHWTHVKTTPVWRKTTREPSAQARTGAPGQV